MSEQRSEYDARWESLVREAAGSFPYPPTPDIAAALRQRAGVQRPSPYQRLAWAAVLAVLLLGGLLAVPEIRAAVLEILRVGGITIFLNEPTATPTATPSPTTADVARTPRPTFTPYVEPTPFASVLDLPGETTLEEARQQASFDILLPTYPDGLGAPDHVFLQHLGDAVVTLAWLNADGSVRLSLQILNARIIGSKYEPNSYRRATVNGQEALWLTGTHILAFYNPGGGDFIRRIENNVLIWEQDGTTYRLEIDTSLEEAIRIAESLE